MCGLLGGKNCFVRAFSCRSWTERNLSSRSDHLMSSDLALGTRRSSRLIVDSGALSLAEKITDDIRAGKEV